MKKFLLPLFSFFCAAQSMQKPRPLYPQGKYRLPEHSVLKKRLQEHGFQPLIDKTRILQLAYKDVNVLVVKLHCTCCLQELESSEEALLDRSKLLKVILNDHPKAIEELKQLQLLDSN